MTTPKECHLIRFRIISCAFPTYAGPSTRKPPAISELIDSQVEVRPSVSVQKALKDSMVELAEEVHLAASYGELSEFLQQRIELVMRFFLALGEGFEAPVTEALPQTSHLEEPTTSVMDAGSDTASIFEMGRM